MAMFESLIITLSGVSKQVKFQAGADAKVTEAAASGEAAGSGHPAPQEKSSSASSSAGPAPADQPSEQCTDLANVFLPDQITQHVQETKAKDIYKNCSLSMPGIALKRFSMVRDLQITPEEKSSYVAVLGSTTVQMYKIKKRGAMGMVMGQYGEDPSGFWKVVDQQLSSKTKEISALCVFDAFQGDINEAQWLTRVRNTRASFATQEGSLTYLLVLLSILQFWDFHSWM